MTTGVDEEDWGGLDAMSTNIWEMFDEFDPFDPDLEEGDLEMNMDYLIDRVAETDNRAVQAEAAWQLSELAYALRGPTVNAPPVSHDNPWREVKDGDPRLLAVFKDHYSYRPHKGQRKNQLVIGPGYKIALILPNTTNPRYGRPRAIFAWRMERYRNDNDYGANCAFFRNESKVRGSDLILWAEEFAKTRWPYVPRFFTHIDTTKVKPIRHRKQRGAPAYDSWGDVFTRAGWNTLTTRTKSHNLLRMEKSITPYGWIDTWRDTTNWNNIASTWAFPERYRHRDPSNGGRPSATATRRQREQVIKHHLQLHLF